MDVLELVKKRNPAEPEFLQAVKEVLESLEPVLKRHSKYQNTAFWSALSSRSARLSSGFPGSTTKARFRSTGVSASSSIAPSALQGRIALSPHRERGHFEILGFEQVFKNSLTTLSMGGGKGGSDFDPKGKSDNEVMRFCQSFMTELFRHIGAPPTFPPAISCGGARDRLSLRAVQAPA
jgi:glutamate dehydrogenase (NADP+)